MLHEERDMLREALSDERTSREEDLHHRDSEIATLKAKVIGGEHTTENGIRWGVVFCFGILILAAGCTGMSGLRCLDQ